MGNQEKAAKGDTVLATSTRLFKGRVVEDAENKKGESLTCFYSCSCFICYFGKNTYFEEYKSAVEGINLTKFTPLNQIKNNGLSLHF